MDEDELEYDEIPEPGPLQWRAILSLSMVAVKNLFDVGSDLADGISWLMLSDALHDKAKRMQADAAQEAKRLLSALDEL